MSRFTRQARLGTVGAILAALLTVIMGVAPVGAASTAVVAVSASPQFPAFGVNTTTINVGCGSPISVCELWATKNGQPIGTEVRIAQITGSTGIGGSQPAITYGINDGCFNFRVYNGTGHAITDFAGGIDVGHGEDVGSGTANVPTGSVNNPGVGSATTSLSVCTGTQSGTIPGAAAGTSTGQPILDVRPFKLAAPGAGQAPPAGAYTVRYDSGFANNIDVAEVYVAQAVSGGPFLTALGAQPPTPNPTNCVAGNGAGLTYGTEVLESRNASEKNSNFSPLGGGPYRWTMYSGTSHTTVIGPQLCTTTAQFLTFNNATGKLFFNTGDSTQNGLVCVTGASTAGVLTPFSANSFGFNPGGSNAPFQFPGAGTNTYTLLSGVVLGPGGTPTPGPAGSCGTGVAVGPALVVTT